MNYINKLASFAVLVTALSGCDFNEDFCIRNGELVAWCDFSGIKEPLPIPAQRHMIAFPLGHTDIPSGTETAFTQDTLRWSIPQGEYRFLFYTGNYKVSDIQNYHEACLTVQTDTVEGGAYIPGIQDFCSSAMFSEHLEYQNTKRVEVSPSAFVQRLNIQINVSGNTVPLSSLKGTLSGISTGRYLVSRERTGNASLTTIFARKQDFNRWRTSLYVFGFSPVAENILTVKVEMDEEDSAFNEEQTVDLTPYVRGFEGEELSLELNLHVGKELTIDQPVVIPDWEEIPETEL